MQDHGLPGDDLSTIEQEAVIISNLEEQLQSAIVQAKANLTNRRSALCITNRLPRDILLHIFQLAIHSRTDSGELGTLTAINISQTCAYWREITIGNPSLWTKVELSALTAPQVVLVASRSGTLPLHIRITQLSTAAPWIVGRRENKLVTIKCFEASFDRAETLEIYSISVSASMPSWLLRQDIPGLKHLDIKFPNRPESNQLPLSFHPNLTHLESLVLHHTPHGLP